MPNLPPSEDGYLFLVVDQKFYALTKKELEDTATLIPDDDGSDISELLHSLVEEGFVLADIQGPGESAVRPDSCACIALNIDKFDERIKEKQQAIAANNKKAKKKKAKKKAAKPRR